MHTGYNDQKTKKPSSAYITASTRLRTWLTGSTVGFSTTPHILIIPAYTIRGVRGSDAGSSEVVKIIWQPLPTVPGSGQGPESRYLTYGLPVTTFSKQGLTTVVQQIHIAIWIESESLIEDVRWYDINLTGDTPKNSHSLRKFDLLDTRKLIRIVGKLCS